MKRVIRLSRDEWRDLSEFAHRVTFGENKPEHLERIDFVLVFEEEGEGKPMGYATCKELDGESLYLQHGGTFPDTRGRGQAGLILHYFVSWARSKGYKRISFLVENTNQAMLKLAMKEEFLIVGVRNFKQSILLEHGLEL